MLKIFGWIILVTFVIGNLGWLLFMERSLEAWLLWQLFAFCLAVLLNAETIKQHAFGKERKK